MCVKSNRLCPYLPEVWGDLLGWNRPLDFNPLVDSFLQRLIKADFEAASFLHRKEQLTTEVCKVALTFRLSGV